MFLKFNEANKDNQQKYVLQNVNKQSSWRADDPTTNPLKSFLFNRKLNLKQKLILKMYHSQNTIIIMFSFIKTTLIIQ